VDRSAPIDGKRVHLENGYPDTGPNGIRNAVFDSDGFSLHEGAGFVTFFRADAPSAQQCAVTYRAAPASSDTPKLTIFRPAVAKLRDSRIFIIRVYGHIGWAYKVVLD
jgi:hypothetical protein